MCLVGLAAVAICALSGLAAVDCTICALPGLTAVAICAMSGLAAVDCTIFALSGLTAVAICAMSGLATVYGVMQESRVFIINCLKLKLADSFPTEVVFRWLIRTTTQC